MNSKILSRACLGAVGVVILSLVAVIPAWAIGGAPPERSYIPKPRTGAGLIQIQNAYMSGLNAMGFRGNTAGAPSAEEGTLDQGPRQLDAEVGAGAHDVLSVGRRPAEHVNNGARVVQGFLIFVVLAVISVSIYLMLIPSDQLPGFGGRKIATSA
jgi:hypothetical protein